MCEGTNNMNKVTKWYKIITDEDGNEISKSFNHYNDGWAKGNYPLPFNKVFTNQVAWKKDRWYKEFARIDENMKIVSVD